MGLDDKSKDSDLFICTNGTCNVITFRPPPSGKNICPKCWEPGVLVRNQDTLAKGVPHR